MLLIVCTPASSWLMRAVISAIACGSSCSIGWMMRPDEPGRGVENGAIGCGSADGCNDGAVGAGAGAVASIGFAGALAGAAVGAGAGCCTAGAGCGSSGAAVATGCAAACG